MPVVARARVSCALPLLLAALAAGCGGGSSDKHGTTTTGHTTPANGPTVNGGLSPKVVRYAAAGLAFRPPAGWSLVPGRPPLVAVARSGLATVAFWRYPRTEQLPFTHPALVAAKEALVAQILKRDPHFRLVKAKLLHVGPRRAVQVLGIGTLAGAPRMIRSTHIYAEAAEYVVDASAPVGLFSRTDRTVFLPLLQTVTISRPGAPR